MLPYFGMKLHKVTGTFSTQQLHPRLKKAEKLIIQLNKTEKPLEQYMNSFLWIMLNFGENQQSTERKTNGQPTKMKVLF